MSRVEGSAFDRYQGAAAPAARGVGGGVAVQGVPDDQQQTFTPIAQCDVE